MLQSAPKTACQPPDGTIGWPGGADLDPDVLYSHVAGKAIPSYEAKAKSK